MSEGRPLPDYIVKEFAAYLRCGIPAFGFLRLTCTKCADEKIIAFSCKKRGFCPSCFAKRQIEAASHLVGEVLPLVPYRQFVVTFPIPLRYWLHANRRLFSKIHSIIVHQVHIHYVRKAKASCPSSGKAPAPKPGSVTFIQRWGSALNLNPHLHILCLDGVYSRVNGVPRFRNIDAITDEEVAQLIESISGSVMRYLRSKGYLDKSGEIVANPQADALFAESESFVLATGSSIAGKIAFGPNAGRYVTRIGSGFGYGEEIPLAKGQRCFSLNGFTLHANTSTNTLQRDRLGKLIEYMARGPLSNERLEILKTASGDKVKLKLKSKWSDGTTHLLFTPEEFIEKLAALVPPPHSHLTRWAGVLAPNSPYRREITLHPEIKKAMRLRGCDKDAGGVGQSSGQGKRLVKNYAWSKMLARVFKIDVSKCTRCKAEMQLMGAVTDPAQVQRYLKHIGVEYVQPARAPPRRWQDSLDFDQRSGFTEH